jgi:hypothetical protein
VRNRFHAFAFSNATACAAYSAAVILTQQVAFHLLGDRSKMYKVGLYKLMNFNSVRVRSPIALESAWFGDLSLEPHM